MRSINKLTTYEMNAFRSWANGDLSYERLAEAWNCTRQGVSYRVATFFRELVVSGKIDISKILK